MSRQITPFKATVTDYRDEEAIHYFEPGTVVTITEDNEDPDGRWPAHRWLAWGPSKIDGSRIRQWLMAEQFETGEF